MPGLPITVRCGVVLLLVAVPTVFVTAGPDTIPDLEQWVHKPVNVHRSSRGLSRLRFNKELAAIARRHSKDMAAGRRSEHQGFDSRRGAVARILPLGSLGENVAWSRASYVETPSGVEPQRGQSGTVAMGRTAAFEAADYIVDGWLDSPSHLQNIESRDYEVTGVGVVQGPNGAYYFTQLFVRIRRPRW